MVVIIGSLLWLSVSIVFFSRAFEKVQRRFVFFVSLHGRASAKSYEKA